MARNTSLLIVVVAVVALPLATHSSPGLAGTDETILHSGYIVGDVTISDQSVQITRAITVLPGATLRFINSTIQLDLDPADCPEACDVYSPIDIYVSPGGRLVLRDSTVTSTIELDGEPKQWSIWGDAGAFTAIGSTFERGQYISFELPATEPATLQGNTFHEVPFSWVRGGALNIQNNTFHGSYTSLHLRDVEATVAHNQFLDTGRFGAIFFAFDVERSTVGPDADIPSGYEIHHNHFQDVSGGIGYRGETFVDLHHNTFQDVGYPFRIPWRDNQTYDPEVRPLIRDNTIRGQTQTLLWTYTGAENDPTLGNLTFTNNNILDPVCRVASTNGLENGHVAHVEAENNWWGSTDGPQIEDKPQCGLTSGQVTIDIEPWAVAPIEP